MKAKVTKILGAVLALVLLLLGYNGTRHLVFWGSTETVNFPSGDLSIVGTFAKPAGDGAFPAVVVLLGSGRETRYAQKIRLSFHR